MTKCLLGGRKSLLIVKHFSLHAKGEKEGKANEGDGVRWQNGIKDRFGADEASIRCN